MSKRKSSQAVGKGTKSVSKDRTRDTRVPRGTRIKARRTSEKKVTLSRKAPRFVPSSEAHKVEIIARGCLMSGSRVLLCRNLKHGYSYLPGGHVEFGESASLALAREFLEECALAIRVLDLVLVSEASFSTKKRWHHEVNLVFHVERVGGVPARRSSAEKPMSAVIKSSEPGIAFDWVELAAIPETDVRPMSAKAWLTTLGDSSSGIEWVSEMATGY